MAVMTAMNAASHLGCVLHAETVYVGYVNTLSEKINITANMRITHYSYDKGLLLYTVHLTDDQGQQFEYHYVTGFCLTPTSLVVGC
jgi:hypothetical protein